MDLSAMIYPYNKEPLKRLLFVLYGSDPSPNSVFIEGINF